MIETDYYRVKFFSKMDSNAVHINLDWKKDINPNKKTIDNIQTDVLYKYTFEFMDDITLKKMEKDFCRLLDEKVISKYQCLEEIEKL